MAQTLSVLSSGIAAARRAGSYRLYKALLAQPDLPPETAVQIHRLVAELAMARCDYPVARRHLRAATRLESDHAPTRYLLGRAYEVDPYGSLSLAAKHFRAAARRERTNAGYWSAYGRAAVRSDNRTSGIKALVRAARLAPADTAVLSTVVEGLLDADRVRTARRILARSRFIAAANATLTALWNRVRFAEACRSQRKRRPARILPFVRLVGNEAAQAGRLVR